MTERRAPPHERQPFCPQCGLVDKVDVNDGTCGYCGSDTCGLDQLREYLATHGLHVVGDAEKAVLDAMREVPEKEIRGWAEEIGDELELPCKAELARREAIP